MIEVLGGILIGQHHPRFGEQCFQQNFGCIGGFFFKAKGSGSRDRKFQALGHGSSFADFHNNGLKIGYSPHGVVVEWCSLRNARHLLVQHRYLCEQDIGRVF